jgi:hypothetical protein
MNDLEEKQRALWSDNRVSKLIRSRNQMPGVRRAAFIFLAGYAALAVFASTHTDNEDRQNFDRLRAAAYMPPFGCPRVYHGEVAVPVACASPLYRLRSPGGARQFGLKTKRRSSGGWYRIGDDAVELPSLCGSLCVVGRVGRNFFGKGMQD